MQVHRPTSTGSDKSAEVSTSEYVDVQRARWWETTYTTVNWDYPPSPASYHDALLCRGASRSRFLRIAYLSTRERSGMPASCCSFPPTSTTHPPLSITSSSCSTSTTSLACPSGSPTKRAVSLPLPPFFHTHAYLGSTSSTHVLRSSKRLPPLRPKPPHYHASLLRSSVSRRKGLFRTILPPSKAVDLFRWEIILDAGAPMFNRSREPDLWRPNDQNTCLSCHVAESVLAPYEAGAGFFGWYGLGLDVIRRGNQDGNEGNDSGEFHWSQGSDEVPSDHAADESVGARAVIGKLSPLQLEIDETDVDEGRAWWSRMAEELVGPPGLALPQFDQDSSSHSVPDHNGDGNTQSTASLPREEVRWDPDIGLNQDHPSTPLMISTSQGKSGSAAAVPSSGSSSNSKTRKDPSLAMWHGPISHWGPPPSVNYTSLHFAPPPPQFSPWYPGIRPGPPQRHGYWYGRSSNGTSSNPHTIPDSLRPGQSARPRVNAGLNPDDYGSSAEGDKDTETDHGYESAATTTDSDPPPHTPTGVPTASRYVGTIKVHEDDDVDMHEVEIDTEHAAASYRVPGLPDPTTPIKLSGRSRISFSSSTSPSAPMDSPTSSVDYHQFPNSAVVFPSLNGSFRQGSFSHPSASSSSEGMSMRSTPAQSMASLHSSSSSPVVDLTAHPGLNMSPAQEVVPQTKLKTGSPEPHSCLHSGGSSEVMLSLCSSPPTSPGRGLRKNSQGFWEPVTSTSPLSTSSSLQSESKASSTHSVGWVGEKTVQALVVGLESTEMSGPALIPASSKTRSVSPGSGHVASTVSTRSSCSASVSLSSVTPTSASSLGIVQPSLTSSLINSAMLPSNPNPNTLLPAFLANTAVKKKRASRTREIVDRLRSLSIDIDSDNLSWLAGSKGELDPMLGKVSSVSETTTGDRTVKEQLTPSLSSKSNGDSSKGQTKAHGQSLGSKGSDGTVGSSATIQRPVTKTNAVPTPFPILSGAKTSRPATQSKGTGGLESKTSVLHGLDNARMNGTMASPSANTNGSQHPAGRNATSPVHLPHPSLPSPSYPTVHAPPSLVPPPMITVAPPYSHPVYVPFAPYQPTQGAWLTVYRPPPLPMQTHVPPITGVSGMRHVSW